MEIPLARAAGRSSRPTILATPSSSVVRSRVAMYGSVDVIGRGFPEIEAGRRQSLASRATRTRSNIGAVDTSELYRPLTPTTHHAEAVLIARARGDAAALRRSCAKRRRSIRRILPAVVLLRDSFERRVDGHANHEHASRLAPPAHGLDRLPRHLRRRVVRRGPAHKEFGIHLALGARRTSIVRLGRGQVLSPMIVGTVLGVAAAVRAAMVLAQGPDADPVRGPSGLRRRF